MELLLQPVTAAAFAPYGRVLAFPAGEAEDFAVLVTEPAQPWRLAVFRYRNREIARMENHPESLESFEPLAGTTVLLVAENATPQAPAAFLLDKPVCLHKGVWHQVLALTEEASVKIAENLEVASEFYDLPHPLRVVLAGI